MSNSCFSAVRKDLEQAFLLQEQTTDLWHKDELCQESLDSVQSYGDFVALVILQHQQNYRLWHVEDSARRKDVDDSIIAQCKRDIDGLNQKRNDLIEQVDETIIQRIHSLLSAKAHKHNTETVGMAVDRLSILALKIFHMHEQTVRTDVDAEHIRLCEDKLHILKQQRKDLIAAIFTLLDEYEQGEKRPILYRQFKMYNDPKLNPELYAAKSL